MKGRISGSKGMIVYFWMIAISAMTISISGCSSPPVRHVAVGWQGGLEGGTIIRTSIYGINWDDDDRYTLSDGRYPGGSKRGIVVNPNNGRFVAVGRSTVGFIANTSYSDDMGLSWLAGTVSTGLPNMNTELYGVAFAEHPLLGETFVAVGDNGTVLRSINGGEFWVSGSSAVSTNLRAVTYGNDRFIAVGEGGTMLRSFDAGQTWGGLNSGISTDLLGIGYGNGVFIVTGADGTILYSSDGETWQQGNSLATEDMHDAVFGYDQDGEGMWVAVGRYGTVRFSWDNGVNWVHRMNASPTTKDLMAVTYAMGKFVAVGENITLYTLDGMDWTIGTNIPGNYHFLMDIVRP